MRAYRLLTKHIIITDVFAPDPSDNCSGNIVSEIRSGAHISRGNTYHCNTGSTIRETGYGDEQEDQLTFYTHSQSCIHAGIPPLESLRTG